MMRIKNYIAVSVLALFTALAVSCNREEPAAADGTYGYVQFRLFKEASYKVPVKGIVSEMDYLRDAHKIKVALLYKDEPLTQTLLIQQTDPEDAEYGIRSEKLMLLSGKYELINYTLYDALDAEMYIGVPGESEFEVKPSSLTISELTAAVTPRGHVHFTITKDMSGFTNNPSTKSVDRQYTFDEVRYMDIVVSNALNERYTYNMVKTRFEMDGKTSQLTTSDVFELKAGEYTLISYNTYTSSKTLLEHNTKPSKMVFHVEDNKTTEAELPVTLYESDEYIKDYYALYEIWKSLGGPDWYYNGVDHNRGSNWNFDKDPDLWGDQPGVQVYSNGRVAMLNLEGYNFSGHLPAAIGQLDQLDQLYLGNHNDPSFLPSGTEDPSLSTATLFQRHKARMESLHMPTPMSEPIARALKEHNISIPEIAMYDYMTEDQLIEKSTGNTIPQVRLMDNIHGVYSNTLKSIDPAIGKLKNLQYLFIANSAIEKLPDTFSQLESLSDFEIYNCPKMTEFPMVICDLPSLVSVNISNNAQWSAAEILKGIKGLANGASGGKIQILYCSQNNLEELPEDIKNFKSMGLIDLMSNKISKVAPFGHEIGLVDCYLDNNRITEIGRDDQGYFCGIEDIETFSATYNQLTELPDIFNSKSLFTMGSVDFSYNKITGVQNAADGTYRGLKVSTLSMTNNPITVFPTAFAESESYVSYFNMRGCFLEEFPEEALTGSTMVSTTSMDLGYNHLSSLPEKTFNGVYLPYLYGVDMTSNRFDHFPFNVLDSAYLTVLSLRGQRDAAGNRCLREWPTGIYQHKGLRGLYLGSNDLRKVSDTISPLCYFLDISDNPNIVFDASDICYEWRAGAYYLLYDKTQDIRGCDYMLQ